MLDETEIGSSSTSFIEWFGCLMFKFLLSLIFEGEGISVSETESSEIVTLSSWFIFKTDHPLSNWWAKELVCLKIKSVFTIFSYSS